MEQALSDEVVSSEQQPNDISASTPRRRNNNKMVASPQTNEAQLTPIEGGRAPRARKMGLLPNSSEQQEVIYKGKVIGETTWSVLPPRRIFSVNSDGSHPYFKLSKSSYVDLTTTEVTTNVPATQQKVYRVSLL